MSKKSVLSALEMMEAMIMLCDNSEKRLKEYRQALAIAKLRGSPNLIMRHWFNEHYANLAQKNLKPQFNDDGFLIAMTRNELEQERNANQEKVKRAALKDFQDRLLAIKDA